MTEPEKQKRRIEPDQWRLVALVVAFSAGALLYRLLRHEHLGQSAAMFLGIPLVLAVLLAGAPKAKTVTGGILKGITLALLILAPLLGEGFLCILIASPLFYLIGVFVGLAVDASRKKPTTILSCVSLIVLPLCMEGVIPALTWNRTQSVTVSRVVKAPAMEVENALRQSPRVHTPLPAWLRIGFPIPLEAHGEGLNTGAMRTIHFAGAEGDPPGDLVMRITERRPGYVRFETRSDSSKLTQWLRWDSSEVEWKAIDNQHTQVTWCVQFERQLDPAWYFVPVERATVHQAAKFLIDANANPEDRLK